jgi:AraC family transcriptional regulator
MLPKLGYAKYHGQTLRKVEFPDFSLADIAYAPALTLRPHAHEHAILCFNMLGGCTEWVGSSEWTLEPSTLRYHAPDEVHADRIGSDGWRIFTVEFTTEAYQRLADQNVVFDGPTQLHDVYLATLGRRLYREFRDIDDASALAIESLVLEVAVEAARRAPLGRETRIPKWLRNAEDLLRERFTRSIVLSAVAREVGVHPVHLARTFHRTFGQTMGDFIRMLRVDFACSRMRNRASLASIALSAGFADQSHFCRTFKRVVGMTPSDYRDLFADGHRAEAS